MSTYKYRVLTKSREIIEGKKDAVSEKELITGFRNSGHVVLSIQQTGEEFTNILSFKRSLHRSFDFFTQDLATLLENGIPMDKSISILLSTQEKPAIRAVIDDILTSVKSGRSLAESLSKHPRAFANINVHMIHAGEEGGVLPQVLKRLGEFQERMTKARKEIVSAMVYPLLLFVVGVLSLVALVTFVIPRFAQVFDGMGMALPLSTRILMELSHLLISYGWIILVVIFLTIFSYKRAMKNPAFAEKVDAAKLKIPLIGTVLWKMEIARFARTLGTLMENGVALLKAIDIVKNVLSNSYLANVLDNVKSVVKEGGGLTAPLEKKGFLPGYAKHLLTVGEETGSLDRMLIKVADNLDQEIEQKIKKIVTLVEPAMILLMGGLIGTIVVSMLTAILSISDIGF
ncbi:MAG: type II secretion system F family protein [Candidatus Anammoxibacter sp.]